MSESKVIELRRSKIFRHFLLSYLLVLVIPLMTGYISYWIAEKSVKAASVQSSSAILHHAKEIIERDFQQVTQFTTQLSLDQSLNKLLSSPKQIGDSYDAASLRSAVQSIHTYSLTGGMLQQFYVYIKSYDAILMPGGAFVRLKDFYSMYHFDQMDEKSWREDVLESLHHMEIMPLTSYVSNQKQTSVVSYMQSLPVNNIQESLGTVVVLIDEQQMKNMLAPISEQLGGWALIQDNKGRLLASVGIDEEAIDQMDWPDQWLEEPYSEQFYDDNLLMTIRSDYFGWHYVACIPKSFVLQESKKIEKVTLTIVFITLAIGLVIGLLLARRYSIPLQHVLKSLNEQIGAKALLDKNPFNFLQGNIVSLIENNKQLNLELDHQLQYSRDVFFRRLAKGEYITQEEIIASIDQTGLAFSGEYGYIAIIRIVGYRDLMNKDILDELNVSKLMIKRNALKMTEFRWHIADLDSDKLILFMSLDQEPDAKIKEKLNSALYKLTESMELEYRIPLFIAVGSVFSRLLHANRSFNEARQSFDHSEWPEKQNIAWYEDLTKIHSTFHYPIDLEMRLLQTIKSGKNDEVNAVIQLIVKENFENRILSVDMFRQLIREIKGTLLKMLEQNPFDDPLLVELVRKNLDLMPSSETKEAFEVNIKPLIQQFCSHVINKKEEADQGVLTRICKFLDQAYGDSDMTIYKVSDELGVPEKYISYIVREYLFESFSNYLEQIRMTKASEQLINTDKTIDEIATAAGYNSPHAFRRAFKRVLGVTPSEYRAING